jgi:multiple sugar transport system permease protein
MPIMVSLLRGDIYKTEYGAVYLGLSMTVLPLFIVYFSLSKHIIAGVALGALKE